MAEKPKPAPAAKEGKGDGKTPRQRFTTVGASRAKKAIKAIRNVNNIASRKSYEYSEAEANEIVAALRAEVDKVANTFRDAIAGKGTATDTGVKFSFG